MTADKLAKHGLATLGVGRLGVMRIGRGVEQLLERLITDLETVQAENAATRIEAAVARAEAAELRARVDQHDAELKRLRPRRRFGARKATEKRRSKTEVLAKRCNEVRTKFPHLPITTVVSLVLEKHGVDGEEWNCLTETEQKRAVNNARKRYRRFMESQPKKIVAVR